MSNLVVFVFWAWLAASLFIYARRVLTRGSVKPTAEAAPTGSGHHADSLADALAGIKMPCDLAPLVSGERLDPRRMNFATSGFAAQTVGTAVADELERLGYSFSPIDDQTLQARRNSTVVQIGVHSDKTRAMASIGSQAAVVADDAVVVEFRLR